jgi:hypothetical protein
VLENTPFIVGDFPIDFPHFKGGFCRLIPGEFFDGVLKQLFLGGLTVEYVTQWHPLEQG